MEVLAVHVCRFYDDWFSHQVALLGKEVLKLVELLGGDGVGETVSVEHDAAGFIGDFPKVFEGSLVVESGDDDSFVEKIEAASHFFYIVF